MSTKVKVVLHKDYIKIRVTRDRRSQYQSLGLPKLDPKYWDATKQRVRKTSLIDYKDYNSTIEREYTIALSKVPHPIPRKRTGRLSLIALMQEMIERRKDLTYSTLTKYRTVQSKLASYLKHCNKEQLAAQDFDLNHVRGFTDYMDKSGMTRNVIINYHKIIRQHIKAWKREAQDNTIPDAYELYKFPSKKSKPKPTLSHAELETLLTTCMDNDTLERARLKFLFQFYAGGMRVSDLMTLRYQNLVGGELNYEMLKSGKHIKLPISAQLRNTLACYLRKKPLHQPTIADRKHINILRNLRTVWMEDLPDLDEGCLPLALFIPLAPIPMINYLVHLSRSLSIVELRKEVILLESFTKAKGVIFSGGLKYTLENLYRQVYPTIESILNELADIVKTLDEAEHRDITNELNEIGTSKTIKNQFVFDFLEGTSIPVNRKLMTQEHRYLMHKRTVVYNRQLQRLQSKLGISVRMTSHLARTAFTNVALEKGATTSVIKGLLGHSSLATTDAYVSSGFPSRDKDELLLRIGE